MSGCANTLIGLRRKLRSAFTDRGKILPHSATLRGHEQQPGRRAGVSGVRCRGGNGLPDRLFAKRGCRLALNVSKGTQRVHFPRSLPIAAAGQPRRLAVELVVELVETLSKPTPCQRPRGLNHLEDTLTPRPKQGHSNNANR